MLNVQQQAGDQEKQQYTNRGASIEAKVEPTLAGLGDCKLTARDADVVFGLFAPDRYEISNHRHYNVEKLEDHYRSLSVLKHRDGISNIKNQIAKLDIKDENEVVRNGRFNLDPLAKF